MSPTSGEYYDDQTYENYREHYAQMSSSNYQQQQNEQQLLLLSLANNQNQTSQIQSQSTTCLPTRSTIDEDEQQLLDAIHAHPNKRDLVLNLLRQMNQPDPSVHQQHRSDPSANYRS